MNKKSAGGETGINTFKESTGQGWLSPKLYAHAGRKQPAADTGGSAYLPAADQFAFADKLVFKSIRVSQLQRRSKACKISAVL
tara:strand:+ start:242 stop:490 length:249 start_codon:yes stop_codon:yes gene_type:complete